MVVNRPEVLEHVVRSRRTVQDPVVGVPGQTTYETVADGADFPDALAEARGAGRPAILDLRVDPKALSPKLVLEG